MCSPCGRQELIFVKCLDEDLARKCSPSSSSVQVCSSSDCVSRLCSLLFVFISAPSLGHSSGGAFLQPSLSS